MNQNESHDVDAASEKDYSGSPQQGDNPNYPYNPNDEPQGTYLDGTRPGDYGTANNYPDTGKSEATTTANEYRPGYDSEGSYYGTDRKRQD